MADARSRTLDPRSVSRMLSADVSSTWTVFSPRPRRSTTPRGNRCSTAICATGPAGPVSRSCRATQSRTRASMSTGRRGPPPSRGVVQRQLPRRPRCRGHRGAVRGTDRRRGRRTGAPAGKAGPGHLPGRGPGPWPGAVGRSGLRGRPGRRGGGPGGRVRLRRGGGPRRPGRGAEESRRRHRRDRSRRTAGPSVIRQAAFTVEPWCLRETTLNLDLLAQSESVFALSNGHLGWRGNLDEGEPHGLPGTYLNGVYALRPLPYAEAGYGFPESGQTVINVTNGKLMRLFVDDEPFDVRYGELRSHERLLDFRAGTLSRHAEWMSPAGQAVS